MAGFGSYSCLIAFFLLSEIIILSPVLATLNLEQVAALPSLPASTHNFSEQCAAKLQTGCDNHLIQSLFGVGIVSSTCCLNLATFGQPCYDEFLVVTVPYHKEVDASKVIAKTEMVWNDVQQTNPLLEHSFGSYSCLIAFFLLSEIVILSPVLAARNLEEVVALPPLPASTHNFLEQCAAKLQTGCDKQIVQSLFGVGIVSPACCLNLAMFGRPCYDEFLVVTLPYHKEVDAAKVIAKSEMVWNDCATVKPSA